MPEVSETTVILPSSGMASAAAAPLPWVGGLMLRRSTSVGENAKNELPMRRSLAPSRLPSCSSMPMKAGKLSPSVVVTAKLAASVKLNRG